MAGLQDVVLRFQLDSVSFASLISDWDPLHMNAFAHNKSAQCLYQLSG
jgi:hypothetical protein